MTSRKAQPSTVPHSAAPYLAMPYQVVRHPMTGAHIPGIPPRPGEPGWPSPLPGPGVPPSPGIPGFPSAPPSVPGPVPPTRVWLDPDAGFKGALYERLLAKRIVLASGVLDDEAAARLSAQLLTLDAERNKPIRLELQNLRAELAATVTVMGILDVLRVPVHACVSGEINGPALGVLASCPHRSGYPNAIFVLTEPRLHFGGTVTSITAREQQMTRMLDTLYFRLAEVTGREVDEIREDARRGRTLTTGQAIGYGLIQGQETASRPPFGGREAGPGDPGRGDPGRG
jgi:ATP-dependent Clp protease, protease subunit